VEDIANCVDRMPAPAIRGSFKDQMNATERNILERSLEKHGSFHKAAQELGLDASTVFRKMKKYGLK
jgi:transcriptional regulator with PAS, ATPase and Fis domain